MSARSMFFFQRRDGVTLIEMLVTIAIILVLTLAVLVTVRTSARPQAVSRAMHTTLLAVRTAQARAASTTTVSSSGQIPYGFGVYFDTSTTNSRHRLIIFADTDGDKTYDPGEEVETRQLPNGARLNVLDACTVGGPSCTSGGSWAPGPFSNLTVYFCPPNPNTFLFSNTDISRGPLPPTATPCSSSDPPSFTRSEVRVRFSLDQGSLPSGNPRCLVVNGAGAAFVQTGIAGTCP